MKFFSILIFLFSLLTITNSINAQDFIPFPNDTAKWSVYSRWSQPGFKIEDTNYYFLNGDTIIDSVVYSKVYSCTANYYPLDTLDARYIGGLRQENKDIYFKPYKLFQSFSYQCDLFNWDLEEFRLYTFDIEDNDVFVPGAYSAEYEVTDIDSILIGTEYRTIYTFDCNSHPLGDKWIEGIGSIISLFGPICDVFEGAETLLCYEDDSVFYFNEIWNPFEGCAHFIVSVPEEEAEIFQIYPNPVAKDKSITIKGTSSKVSSIQIVDLKGKPITSYQSPNLPFNLKITSNKGIYLLILKTENDGCYYQKLIVQ
jgi:hypothetical protein